MLTHISTLHSLVPGKQEPPTLRELFARLLKEGSHCQNFLLKAFYYQVVNAMCDSDRSFIRHAQARELRQWFFRAQDYDHCLKDAQCQELLQKTSIMFTNIFFVLQHHPERRLRVLKTHIVDFNGLLYHCVGS